VQYLFFVNDFKALAFEVVLFFLLSLFFSPSPMKSLPTQKHHPQKIPSSMIRKEIRLFPEQLRVLQKGAKNHSTALSRFIPQAALSYCNQVFITPDKGQMQQVALSCREVSNALYDIAYKHKKFTQEDLQSINDMVAVLEQSLLHILNHPLRLEDILRQAFKEKKLRAWLLQQVDLLKATAA
jgi:hypothetical protein